MGTLGQGRVTSVILWIMAAVGLLFIAGPDRWRQDFPSKPITIIVPFGPGGIIDVGTRIIAERLSKELKVPVIIENKPGGGAGLIGITAFLNSTNANPDGYTLLFGQRRRDHRDRAALQHTHLGSTQGPVARRLHRRCTLRRVGRQERPVQDVSRISSPMPRATPANSGGACLPWAVKPISCSRRCSSGPILKARRSPIPKTGDLVPAILGGHLDWMALSMPATLAVPQVR